VIHLATSVEGAWDPYESPFYLEVYGETAPLLNTAFADVLGTGPLSADSSSGTPSSTISAPVYEYWWTLGFHRGHSPEEQHWRDRLFHPRNENLDAHGGAQAMSFEDPAAWVGLFFPTGANWRAKEISATLKFLTPIKDQHQMWQDISENIAKLSPLLADAGSLASLVPGGAMASTVLSTVAKLQVGSVPQKSVNWSVEKTTLHPAAESGPWQGVEWRLPQNTFEVLGGRVSGSVAVTFMEALRPSEDEATPPEEGTVMARANVAVQGMRGLLRVPSSETDGDPFLSLKVAPQRPGGNRT